ncbi:MAG: carotenoid oxygenase family protein [Tenacibaculum sp.]
MDVNILDQKIKHYAAATHNPYISGPFAPVFKEIVANKLEVIGEIPKDINGAYMRNGPNPKYTPMGHYHWFDGDGMVHALYLQDRKAIYKNKWVRTIDFNKDSKANKALWEGAMGYMNKNKMNKRLPLKDTANTAVFFHNKYLYAGWYMCGNVYKMDLHNLNTVGKTSFGDTLKTGLMAHVKVDFDTDEVMFFDYGPTPPFLTYGIIKNDEVVHFCEIDVPNASLPHDLAITKNYSILMDLPLVMDQNAYSNGRAKIVFKDSKPSRFAVIPRYGSNKDVKWFTANPCFIYHVVNAWEEGNEIVMDVCVNIKPTPQKGIKNPVEKLKSYLRVEAYYYRYRFNLEDGQTKEQRIDDRLTEFPMINASKQGKKTKYSYHQKFDISDVVRFEGIIKFDTETNSSQTYLYGNGCFGSESPFIPREGATQEDDGYIISFVTNANTHKSEAIILNAKNINSEPLAIIKLPQRVPLGFHGCWIPGNEIS